MYKKIIAITLIIVALLTFTLLPACRKKAEPGELDAGFTGSTLSWKAYEGASYYVIACTLTDGSGYTVKTTDSSYVAPYKTAGDYLYAVKAYSEQGDLLASSPDLLLHLGKGSPTDPIDVSTADELLEIKGKTTVTFGEQTVSAPLYYQLAADIDLSGRTITPIGNTTSPFIGAFDGNGHTIKGLSFTKCNADGSIGLFGAIKNAVVKNLTLENASIVFDSASGIKKSALYFGLLIGLSTSSMVDNCHVTGKVDVLKSVITTDNNVLSAGGVIGKVDSGKITCCSFSGSVAAQYGITYSGGLIGFGQGESPEFMLLNSISNATVSAIGTAFNATTGASYAYARAGVLVGNVSTAGRFASLVAIGSATADTTRSGTSQSNLTAGVFGRSKVTGSTSTIPMYHIYYSDSIGKPVGNASSLGDFTAYVYPLSDEELRNKEVYRATTGYGLDFDELWSIKEGELPTLRGVSSLPIAPALDLTIRSEIKGKEFTYDLPLTETFLPTYFNLSLVTTTLRSVGYNLSTLFAENALNIDLKEKMRVKFSAEGLDDLIVTLSSSSIKCYLVYGNYSEYEATPGVFGGYKIVDLASLKTYDFSGAKHLTITILPEETEA